MEKRVLKSQQAKNRLGIAEFILIGVLLAAGMVLKFFVGSIINFGMKPNFIIAMYCLIILLIRPRFHEAAIIGLLAGTICQFFPGQPYINLVSELVGAIVISLLIKIPMKIKKFSLQPIICTFLTTIISGAVFIGIMYMMYYFGADVKPTALGVFTAIILGTAIFNSIIVQILYIPLKRVLKKDIN